MKTGNSNQRNHQMNTLEGLRSYDPQPGIFEGEVASAFNEWSIRFNDYVDVFGRNWTEIEKLNRLKLYLGTQARKIFENLPPWERNTLEKALMSIKNKLDSPHLKELAYKKLAACYQREGESVGEFIKRLVPLVNTTSSQVPNDVKEETLCRCFMEKVRPEFQRSLQLVGPLLGRKDFDKLATYVQELEVAIEKENNADSGIHEIQEQDYENQIPGCSFSTWEPISENRTPQDQGLSYNETQETHASADKQQNIWQSDDQWRPQNEHRWYERPVCHYCKRVGHKQYNCWEREWDSSNLFNLEQNDLEDDNDWKREIQEMKERLDDLTVQAHELKMNRDYNSAEF